MEGVTTCTFDLPTEEFEALELLASRKGCTVTHAIREGIATTQLCEEVHNTGGIVCTLQGRILSWVRFPWYGFDIRHKFAWLRMKMWWLHRS